ncbi:hypothetical protein [Faecalibacter rhinopitheci]|uniref:Uncharacterized protein n=1 Tax=Faecalibacter rhinopitheci TaxID=2779678 RepID=A0A8J7KIV2_9FLAO|nr:hypothetical protein [Faecalibacter rhinopitheci]MBF0598431.1 hypothetical protein [Faecalibacter rhinopitheci]
MNIKIPPYPNFIIKNKTLEANPIPIENKSSFDGLSNQLIMMVPFNESEQRVLRTRAILHQGINYISALPNPVHLFLTLGIENYNLSENIKFSKFPKCGKQMGDDLFILPIEENGTHQCYNDYIKYRTSSIIMLVSSLEAFINHILPNDFIYETEKKKFTKIEIESPKVNFKDKIEKVIPQFLKDEKFWDNHIEIKLSIDKLYQTRKNLIHLKTNAEDDFSAYFQIIDEMLDFNISNSIDSLISFMNLTKSNFIELSD